MGLLIDSRDIRELSSLPKEGGTLRVRHELSGHLSGDPWPEAVGRFVQVPLPIDFFSNIRPRRCVAPEER